MFKHASKIVAALALAGVTLLAGNAQARPGGGGGGGGSGSTEVRLLAFMRNSSNAQQKLKSVYRERTVNSRPVYYGPVISSSAQKIETQVDALDPNTSYDILLNGTKLGSVTTDGAGNAKIEFESGVSARRNLADIPHLKAGDTITVGPLSTTFAKR